MARRFSYDSKLTPSKTGTNSAALTRTPAPTNEAAMQVQLDVVKEIETDLSREGVLRALGSPSPNSSLAKDLDWAIEEAERLAEPRALLRSLTMEEAGRGRVVFSGGTQITGKMLPHLFEGAEGGIFGLATAGPGIEEAVRGLFETGDSLEAFVLDAAGSAIAMDGLTQVISDVVDELDRTGSKAGYCLVPGSSYWELSGQRAVFDALPTERIGVRLLESMLMVPQKSQSVLIPFGRNIRVHGDPTASPCRTCNAVHCPMRSEEFAGEISIS